MKRCQEKIPPKKLPCEASGVGIVFEYRFSNTYFMEDLRTVAFELVRY